jgi:hypothetical protein
VFDGQAQVHHSHCSIESLHKITDSSSRVHCDMHGNFRSASSVETGLM